MTLLRVRPQLRAGRTTLGLCALAWVALGSFAPTASAQREDDDFCRMLSALSEEHPERIGGVESGRTGRSSVRFDRSVTPGATYLLIVALSAEATSASVTPAERVGDQAPLRNGMRVAHDFSARSSGTIAISFHAPPGTRYHAAIYRLGSGREGFDVRPSALAIDVAGAGTALSDASRHPPDCQPPPGTPGDGEWAMAPRWRVRTDRLVIRGSMPRAEIVRVLDRARGELTHCAGTSRADGVRLTLVIAATGSVASAGVAGGSPELARCITAAARRWRFPQTGAGITSVEVSISFTRGR